MSLRDRFQPAAPEPSPNQGPGEEAQAAHKLAALRGRAPIAPAPNAGRAVGKLIRALMPQAGLGLAELKRRWNEIAGAPFADKTAPEKLAAGVLTLRAPGALAPLLQQQAPLLIDRLKLAGVQVKAIRIEQRAIAARPANLRPIRRDLGAAEETALAQTLDHVQDPGLKSALMRLGRALKQG